LEATVEVLTPDLDNIGETLPLRETDTFRETLTFTTLPTRGWYLIAVTRTAGSGPFTLYTDGTAGQVIDIAADVELPGTFAVDTLSTASAPGTSYIFDGTLGDQITVSVNVADESAASPEIVLLDVRQRELETSTGTGFALLRHTLPRSGTYIIQVNNLNPQEPGTYNLRISNVEGTPDKLDTIPATYNNAYKGAITDDNVQVLYAIEGKAGELVSIEMGTVEGNLDPFLVVMDDALNELIVNDNSRGSQDARIAQFALPADGTYYVLAGRANLGFGETTGAYNLQLSAGAISLEAGVLTATANWSGDDDLNLFVREPSGRILSWANPTPSDGGVLQVDSNTNCETISAQPVEHIYWSPTTPPEDGDYEVWAWYQQTCGGEDPLDFAVTIAQPTAPGDEPLMTADGTLTPGQRFEIGLRVSNGQVFLLDDGRITEPSAQQRVSEGGDIPLVYGDQITGSIDDNVFARFYQFEGRDGDEITIEVEAVAGNLDPLVILRDDNERNIASADDSPGLGKNARLTYTLTSAGRYVIAVTRFGVGDGTTTGNYTLTIRRN
ncbi:MAG: PPC domain-containing protein, partial [Chloroflexota bacterium]